MFVCGVMIDAFPKVPNMKFAHTSAELQFPRTKKGRDSRPICDWFIIVHVIILVNPKQEVLQSEKSQREWNIKMW